jgi:D-alanyl-D-alanine carboxypeptidase
MKSSFYEVIILRAIIVIFLVKIFTLGLTFSAFAAPSIEGESFILIDGKTGQVLYGKDINRKLHPASTTKILTTIIALEKGNLKDTVTISKNVPLVEGTKVYLREGEKISLEKLLHAAMVHSANDAALAIAEHIANSEERFAKLMNIKAQEIGAKNSNFVNAHGLTAENHLTTQPTI